MLSTLPRYILIVTIYLLTTIHAQQLQWILLSDGTSSDTPIARRDAALGFDQSYLILFGGRTQTGTPLQDSYSFNIQTGHWDALNFPSPPPSRYGMASTSSINSGLYIFGGFGFMGSSPTYNHYLSNVATQDIVNYNYETPPNFVQNPILLNNPNFVNNPNYNPTSGTGYSTIRNYDNNDDNADENYYPFQDAWFLSYSTKTWQETQSSEYARAFGSASVATMMGDTPKLLYTMGKSRDSMYSLIEVIGRGTSGLSQSGTTQAAMIMHDLPSYSPAYPHARYGHSTALLTDNYLLLYGGCLSGFGKGGPCPSKDTWLLQIDTRNWERISECPPTKTGATMVTLPSTSTCSSMGVDPLSMSAGMGISSEPVVAILWGGREFNPSSIRSYLSPRDEVAVFSLNQKEWYLKRAAPSPTDGSYPMQREGAAFVAGCFQGVPGMFVFGGRAIADRRLLSDLWFLQASPQGALSAPNSRGCIFPFSYYHLHGIFQFFAYGIVFPIGYLVGRVAITSPFRRPLHIILQLFGLALAICGFSFGIHASRTPSRLHFRHAHGIIGIITFILTVIQFLFGAFGSCLIKSRAPKKPEEYTGSGINTKRISIDVTVYHTSRSIRAWRIIHRILGSLILTLGLVNISLGVFLAVLPLPVWIIWYIYMSILVIALVIAEIVALRSRYSRPNKKQTKEKKGMPVEYTVYDQNIVINVEKREDPKGASQSSLKYFEEPIQQPSPPVIPQPRRSTGRIPSASQSATFDNSAYRQSRPGTDGSAHDEMSPFIYNQSPSRSFRPSNLSAPASIIEYNQYEDREYTIPTRKKSRPVENDDDDGYENSIQENINSQRRSASQQQDKHSLSRVNLK